MPNFFQTSFLVKISEVLQMLLNIMTELLIILNIMTEHIFA